MAPRVLLRSSVTQPPRVGGGLGEFGARTAELLAEFPEDPLLASAGQVAALSTGMLHSASNHTNPDAPPRRVLLLEFTPASVEIGLPPDLAELKLVYDAKLRGLLRPGRRYLVAGSDGPSRDMYGAEFVARMQAIARLEEQASRL